MQAYISPRSFGLVGKMSLVYVHLTLLFICRVSAVPKYLPDAQGVRDNTIETYFFAWISILGDFSNLSALHGVNLSLRQLKRVFHSRGLQRRRVRSILQDI